ncbi:MAG TPA: sulfite exporter TauE/SafE family protein, partial [Dehalococcoidia bacterium]|nr:sulfite exporter TauE/SafE family protein [Dehalococcoidia bacterium]
SSLLGIGGGIIHVPVLVEFLHFPVQIATATSHFILSFMALVGTAGYLTAGTLGPHAGLDQVLLLSLGVVPGAQLGARFSHRVRGGLILRLLGVALGTVGVRLVLTPLIG